MGYINVGYSKPINEIKVNVLAVTKEESTLPNKAPVEFQTTRSSTAKSPFIHTFSNMQTSVVSESR